MDNKKPMGPETLRLLKELTELSGPPSDEGRVINYMKKELGKYADEIIQDRLGSTFGVKYSKAPDAPKVMIAGHMDEIGFMIYQVEDDGLLLFQPLGGWWSQTLLSQRVILHGDNDDFVGVVTTRAIRQNLSNEQKTKALSITDMVIDCGASTRDEALSFGIRPGTYVTPQSEFVEMKGGNRLLGKAFDDRYGCATVIELMRDLKDIDLPCHLYAGGTVQEEGGLRGAGPAANLVQPDLFIALDSSAARDVSGKKRELARLGEGFMLRVFDQRMRPSKALRDFVRQVAEDVGIKYQWFFSYGSTDAAMVQVTGIGVPALVIGIPSRYNHSHSVIIDKRDYEASREIMIEVVKRITREKFEEFVTF